MRIRTAGTELSIRPAKTRFSTGLEAEAVLWALYRQQPGKEPQ